MAPTIRTAEYDLLYTLIEGIEVPARLLNQAALEAAIDAGYAQRLGDHVFITSDGYDRFDKLNDR